MVTNSGVAQTLYQQSLHGQQEKRARLYVDNKKYFFFLKRLFDISVSFLLLILVMSWLTPLVAMCIKLSSRGPVFFLQRRSGRCCKTFVCFKFRTMVANSEADIRQASEFDDRITPVGRFLRKTNIDEFPQLLNVLLGDMSIVGPRPHMLSECNWLSSSLPDYKFRRMVRPGITGLAQVKGFHGPSVSHESMFRRYQWDAYYVRNAGLWLDIRIIYKTAGIWPNFLRMYFNRLRAERIN
jgi:putative colanic acid biosynthesis UDP-glucose lipid carrier transferase